MPASSPHDDALDTALDHFNVEFRHRYRLPAMTPAWVKGLDEVATAWTERVGEARSHGLSDATCAVLARIALSIAPRYAIGILDGTAKVHVLFPHEGDDASYRSHNAVLVNPFGGYDNWAEVSRWFRAQSQKQRRQSLAGLASKRRPEYQAIDQMLRAHDGDRAKVLPPDEFFNASRAKEVAYIYQVEVETLRAWKRALRAERASGKSGRPRNR